MIETLSDDQAIAILARALCEIDGLTPDDNAPRQLVCGPYGEVLPNWEAYREKAEAVLACGLEVTDVMTEAALLEFRLRVREYDADFRRLDRSDEGFWEHKYGTRLHSTGLGEQRAMKMALGAALSTKKDA